MNDYYFNISTKVESSQSDLKLVILGRKSDFSPENVALLSKIVGALKLSYENDCSIVEIDADIMISTITSTFEYIIIFGLTPSQVNLNLQTGLFKVNRLEKNKILFANALEELRTNDQLKATLWKSLQIMFDLVKPN